MGKIAQIFAEADNGIKYGKDEFGQLFIGTYTPIFTVKDTPNNRKRMKSDFEYWSKIEEVE